MRSLVRRAPWLLALLPALLWGGCAARRLECPEHGGGPWREYRTQHFRLRSDADPAVVHETARSLEEFRRALLLPFGAEVDPPGVLDVVLFQDKAGYDELLGDETLGLFGGTGLERGIFLQLGAAEDEDGVSLQRVVAHELVHYLSRFVLLRQPRWLAEGLAQDLEGVEVATTAQGLEVQLGKVPGWVLRHGVDPRSLWPLPELWRWEVDYPPDAGARAEFYLSSWAWTVYLRNRHPERWRAFLGRLMRPEPPREAWRASFAGLADDALHADLRAYFDGGKNEIQIHGLPEVPVKVEEGRPLAGSTVHALRARIRRMEADRSLPASKRAALIASDVAEALRQEPGHLEAQVLALQLAPPAEKRARGEALVREHPTRGEAWLAFGAEAATERDQDCERLDAYQRAQAHLPESADVQLALAWELVAHGRYTEALPLTERLLTQAAWYGGALAARAAALQGVGQCVEGVDYLRRALDALEEGESPEVRARYVEWLREAERHCRPARAAPTPATPPGRRG